MSDLPSSKTQVWEFDRYVNGRLMAEGIVIERAQTQEQAFCRAAQMAYSGDVLVLRAAAEPSVEPVAWRYREKGFKLWGYTDNADALKNLVGWEIEPVYTRIAKPPSAAHCPDCGSGLWYAKNGPTGAQATCKHSWHERATQPPADVLQRLDEWLASYMHDREDHDEAASLFARVRELRESPPPDAGAPLIVDEYTIFRREAGRDIQTLQDHVRALYTLIAEQGWQVPDEKYHIITGAAAAMDAGFPIPPCTAVTK